MRLRLQQFSGIAPKISNQLLPDNMAVDARNCRLLSGELRGVNSPLLIHSFASFNVQSAYRINDAPNADIWLGFTAADTDFVEGPLVNDAYKRVYWTGDPANNYLAMNTRQRLRDNDPAYRTGVPAPTVALIVTPDASGSGDVESRVYIYTFVNELGEESAPSPPTIMDGKYDDVWNLSGLATVPVDSANRVPIVKRRIYRTVFGQVTTNYYFVADIDNMVDTTFVDSLQSSAVVQNNICDTFSWTPPPDNLTGLTAHPGGFFVAFNGKEIHFSEPYRPWAWPIEYVVAVEFDIVGLGIFGNTIMVMTASSPYYMSGTHPINFSLTQSQSTEPCVSKRSIVSTLQGVIYASPNGLVLFNGLGANIITNPLITRDEWAQRFSPPTLKAAQRGMQYLAFQNQSNGFEFSPAEPLGVFSTFDRFTNVDNLQTDRYDGTVYYLSRGDVYRWDPVGTPPVYFVWTSKEFDFPRPANFGAVIVKTSAADSELSTEDALAEVAWNADRVERPLNPLGYTPLAGVRWQLTPDPDPTKENFPLSFEAELEANDRRQYPLGGSPLFSALGFRNNATLLRIYADRRLKASLIIRPNKTMRLPSGFKAHYWQLEIISNTSVYSIAMAETAKELMDV